MSFEALKQYEFRILQFDTCVTERHLQRATYKGDKSFWIHTDISIPYLASFNKTHTANGYVGILDVRRQRSIFCTKS